MKFDFQLESDEDIEHFKVLFVRNFGTEQNLFEFHIGNVMIRMQVAGVDGGQMITIGFFSVEKQGKSTTIMQFCPLTDNRYVTCKAIQDIWQWNANQAWGTFFHGEQGIDSAFESLKEILDTVIKVNTLKVPI